MNKLTDLVELIGDDAILFEAPLTLKATMAGV